jgi:D-cysteine desulfhydrase
MANAAAELLDYEKRWTADEIRIENDYIGPGYSIPSEAGNAAIKLAGNKEGVLLDPVYTGKAFAGIIGCVEKGSIEKDASVLFIHCGGSPALYPFAGLLTSDLNEDRAG